MTLLAVMLQQFNIVLPISIPVFAADKIFLTLLGQNSFAIVTNPSFNYELKEGFVFLKVSCCLVIMGLILSNSASSLVNHSHLLDVHASRETKYPHAVGPQKGKFVISIGWIFYSKEI
ncbi:MAG: hypothetical protein AAFU57_17295 [Bacteroidota bacterium]